MEVIDLLRTVRSLHSRRCQGYATWLKVFNEALRGTTEISIYEATAMSTSLEFNKISMEMREQQQKARGQLEELKKLQFENKTAQQSTEQQGPSSSLPAAVTLRLLAFIISGIDEVQKNEKQRYEVEISRERELSVHSRAPIVHDVACASIAISGLQGGAVRMGRGYAELGPDDDSNDDDEVKGEANINKKETHCDPEAADTKKNEPVPTHKGCCHSHAPPEEEEKEGMCNRPEATQGNGCGESAVKLKLFNQQINEATEGINVVMEEIQAEITAIEAGDYNSSR